MLLHRQLVAACLFSFLLLFSTVAESSLHYKVVHVADDDSLNIRAGAGVSNVVVAVIPFDGSDIKAMGKEHTVGKTVWVKIGWQGKEGWVSKHYLQEQINSGQPVSVIKDVNVPTAIIKPAVTKETVLKTQSVDAKQESPVIASMEEIEEDVKIETLVDSLVDSQRKADEKSLKIEKEKNTTLKTTVVKAETINTEKSEEFSGKWILQCGDKKPYWKVELHAKSLEVYRDKYTESLPITLKKQHKNKWNTALKTVVKGKKGKDTLEMTIKYAYSKRCYDTLSSLVVPYKVTTVFNGETLTGCCHAVQLKEEMQERQISKAP